MSALIDLMPEACRRRIGRKRRARRWLAAYVATAVALTASIAGLRVHARGQRAEVDRLREVVDLDADQRRQATGLEARIGEARLQLDRQERLSLPVRVGDVVALIGKEMPDSVSLTALAFTPRMDKAGSRSRAAAAGAPGGGAKPAASEPQKRLIVELSGISPNDIDMAGFVAGLEASPLFKHVAVDFARKSVIRGVEGREFAITCEVDLGKRYEFERVERASGEESGGEGER